MPGGIPLPVPRFLFLLFPVIFCFAASAREADTSDVKHFVPLPIPSAITRDMLQHKSGPHDTSLAFLVPSKTYISKRKNIVLGTTAVSYVGLMSGLYELWYSDYPLHEFHFFNDNPEWFQMDKVGHAINTFQGSEWMLYVFKWTGMEHRKAVWYGGLIGFAYPLSIEILDGFSPGWGFSSGDVIANTTGSAMLIAQELCWEQQKVRLKFSYHNSPYASYRPSMLGSSLWEKLLKDYNGQTYWLSANIASFTGSTSRFPKWLNIAVGYGAEGLIGGRDNLIRENGKVTLDYSSVPRYRQYYISLDIDLSRIKSKSYFLNTVLRSVGFIKIPAPALEIGRKGNLIFHPLYF